MFLCERCLKAVGLVDCFHKTWWIGLCERCHKARHCTECVHRTPKGHDYLAAELEEAFADHD